VVACGCGLVGVLWPAGRRHCMRDSLTKGAGEVEGLVLLF
jgi:hypothetical protein